MVELIELAIKLKTNIPYHENSSKNKTYHTMRTVSKRKHILP
jgi:hypothetical protein